MGNVVQWIMMILSGAVGVMGLIVASRAHEIGMIIAGVLFFAFGFLFVMNRAGRMAEERGKREAG